MNINNLIVNIERHINAGNLQQAQALCEKILRKAPANIDAIFLLGTIHMMNKRYGECEKLFNRVLATNPRHIGAKNNLAVAALEQNHLETAENYFREVILFDPTFVDAQVNLGNLYLAQGKLDAAEPLYKRALTLKADNGVVINNLGSLLRKRGELDEAKTYLQQALKLLPENPAIYVNLGSVLLTQRDIPACIELVHKINSLPNPGLALLFVFSVAKKVAQWDLIQTIREKMLEVIFREHIGSTYLQLVNLDILTDPDISNEILFRILKMTGDDIARMVVSKPFEAYPQALMSLSRLRIGYLSADFKEHVSSIFIRGPINTYDKAHFEVHLYSNSSSEDAKTLEYKSCVDAFNDVSKLSDWELAQRIHQDGIHILVDLSGYTSGTRIHVLAYRPAPIQIAYLGYPYTTGMDVIDYIISDPYLDGPLNAQYCAEKPLRLPESFVSFGELYEQKIDSNAPFERNGFITFGTLGNVYKLNPEVVRVWSRILKSVPNAKLIVNHPGCALEITRSNIANEFARHGVVDDQLKFIWEKHLSSSHLRYYNDIDIALDSFPLTGGVTTIEAVWMGAPVITLVGETHAQRLSYSILKNVGLLLDDLIAFSEEEYIEKAVALAANPARVDALRKAIPEALKGSILCDPARFTRQMEVAYLDIWKRKFPDYSIGAQAVSQPTEFVTLSDGSEIPVQGSLNDLYTYVLKEQGGWFEAEHGFLIALAEAGMRVVDIGDDPGVYAIPLARKVGENGAVHAISLLPGSEALLEQAKRHNHLENLQIELADKATTRLDERCSELGVVDIVRLSEKTNDGRGGLAKTGLGFFSNRSPLVMVSIRNEGRLDLSVLTTFLELDYRVYRLIPGVSALVPYEMPDELDVFSINLFCCKEDTAQRLEQRGLLVRNVPPIGQMQAMQDVDIYEYLGKQAYTRTLLPEWLARPASHAWSDVYLVALNLFVRSKNWATPLPDRLAYLQTSYVTMATLVAEAPNLSRLLSVARIAVEFGKREAAVGYINQIVGLFQQGAGLSVDEPFLPLTDDQARMETGSKVGEWIYSAVLEQQQALRAFSSYFTGKEAFETLEAVARTGFASEDTLTRLKLIKLRYPSDGISAL